MISKADYYMVRDIHNILQNGCIDENPRPHYEDGTPAHTYSVNGMLRRYDLSKGEFPILTARPIAWKSAIREVFTIYQHPTNNIEEMAKMKVNWWSPWDIGDGTIGNRYGHTVNRYDLMNRLLKDIKENPFGRRHIIDLWQYEELDSSDGLAPCAFLTDWNVRKKVESDGIHRYLDMTLFQRSGDMLVASGAGCTNEVQYAALLMMVARHLGYEAGEFIHYVANEQIYDRHLAQATEIRGRIMDNTNDSDDIVGNVVNPKMILNPKKGIDSFFDITIDDFTIEGYEPVKPQMKFDLGI